MSPVDEDRELYGTVEPMSPSASSAARIVRPEKSTSSTSTTRRPSMPSPGISVRARARAGRIRRSSRYIVMSSDPTGVFRPVISSSFPAVAGEEDPSRRDAEKHHVVGALGAFDDLVGDPGQYPGDVGSLENGACRIAGVVMLCVHKKRTSFSASLDGR